MDYLKLKIKWVFCFLLVSSVFFACNDEVEEGPLQEETEENTDNLNRTVNNWTFAVMNEVYYWLDEMGAGGSRTSEPPLFLRSLMVPQDRYTLMRPSASELEASLEGRNLEAGYEFNLILGANGRDVLGAVTYIKSNSPAASTALRRGDFITAINGVAMDTSNFRAALANIRQPHTITYAQLTPGAGLSTIGDIEMQVTEVAENPNFLDTVLVAENEKIGYFVYNFFAPGPDGSFDTELAEIFGKFKQEGVQHLVVDLRYNGGGFTSSAVELASHIGSNVNSNTVFFRNRYNSFLERFDQFQNVVANFTDAANNIGNQLANNRVYIITSNRTASSSELVINGLKPFMDVYLVGDVTEGKNVGSALLRDNQNEDNDWGLLPIIFKSFNADDRSDYGEGFIPNRGPINEFMELPFQALGDPEEFLLRNTIDVILGRNSVTGRRNVQEGRALPYSSLERHLRHGQAVDNSKNEDLLQVIPF